MSDGLHRSKGTRPGILHSISSEKLPQWERITLNRGHSGLQLYSLSDLRGATVVYGLYSLHLCANRPQKRRLSAD